jgi:hypothetical protein
LTEGWGAFFWHLNTQIKWNNKLVSVINLLNISGTQPLFRRLKKSAVPHIFEWSKAETSTEANRKQRAKKRLYMEMEAEEESAGAWSELGAEEIVTTTDSDGKYVKL